MPLTKLTAIPILGLLTWRPLSGYDLKVTIERSLGNFWSESYGQIYPQLAQLAQDGLIEPEVEPPSSGRNKKVYRITDAGRRALADWLAVPPASRPKRDELLLKLFFSTEGDPAQTLQHCRQAKAETEAELERYRSIRMQIETQFADRPQAAYWLMTLDYGIRQAETRLGWCRDTIHHLSLLTKQEQQRDQNLATPLTPIQLVKSNGRRTR